MFNNIGNFKLSQQSKLGFGWGHIRSDSPNYLRNEPLEPEEQVKYLKKIVDNDSEVKPTEPKYRDNFFEVKNIKLPNGDIFGVCYDNQDKSTLVDLYTEDDEIRGQKAKTFAIVDDTQRITSDEVQKLVLGLRKKYLGF